jgi:hypothetical protein
VGPLLYAEAKARLSWSSAVLRGDLLELDAIRIPAFEEPKPGAQQHRHDIDPKLVDWD